MPKKGFWSFLSGILQKSGIGAKSSTEESDNTVNIWMNTLENAFKSQTNIINII